MASNSKSKSKTNEDSEKSSNNAGSSNKPMTIDALKQYLTEKLHITESTTSSKSVKVLEEFTLDEIARLIKSGKCTNIITLAGAGISTSAGIPDFRSPGSGLYDNLKKYNLPSPQAIFELDFFEDNPKPFFVLAKELYPGSFKPTLCHYFIKLLELKGILLRHYTQNIDTLERVAKISNNKLVEAHGTFFTGHCRKCFKEYSLSWMKERIFNDEIPKCLCSGVVKPDIIFFGENLPEKFYYCSEVDFHKCDLLIILGSSLVVQPFASLVDRVSDSTPRLLINREKVGQNGGLMALLGIGGGLEYDSTTNSRDVAWIGDCDEGCQLLADKLGWGTELKQLYDRDCKRIDDEMELEWNIIATKKTPSPEQKLSTKGKINKTDETAKPCDADASKGDAKREKESPVKKSSKSPEKKTSPKKGTDVTGTNKKANGL